MANESYIAMGIPQCVFEYKKFRRNTNLLRTYYYNYLYGAPNRECMHHKNTPVLDLSRTQITEIVHGCWILANL